MALSLKAIETIYGGHRFRSRLEARWAVFLDECGLKFDYEPEGFDLNGLRYLPDFWIHPQRVPNSPISAVVSGFWLEVKGTEVSEGDQSWVKARELAAASRAAVVIFSGQISTSQFGLVFRNRSVAVERDGRYFIRHEADERPNPVHWQECPWCSCIQPVQEITDLECGCWMLLGSQGRPLGAIEKAMQARFEHGERCR